MIPVFATALDLSPLALVHVGDPSYPGADATSADGAVLLAPPAPGTKWTWESVPEPDVWHGTEASDAMNADVWRADGATGEGVKVAVFDLQWFGEGLDPDVLGPNVSTHDCYVSATCDVPFDTVHPRFGFESGIHGYACAQVVHDVAPDAELNLVRVNGQTTLENAVDWAIRNDVDVISMSLSFFNTSFYDGTGAVNAQMERLADAGILMVASSGNYADAHWKGDWNDADGDGRLDFDGSNGLWIHLSGGYGGAAYVTWNQFHDCGVTDLDAWLVDADGNVLGRSEDAQDGDADHCEPVERLNGYPLTSGWYRLEVRHVRGPTAFLSVNVLATSASLAAPIAEGSIADPSSSPVVLSVGAVRADGYLDNDVEYFSSWGPTSDGRSKPDIAGPDGLTTQPYGPLGFYGTSASTPAVTGAIALVMSSDPGITAREAADRLQGWALGDTPSYEAPDPRWGAGKARLPVTTDEPSACGRRPLLLPLVMLPFGAFRRKGRRRW